MQLTVTHGPQHDQVLVTWFCTYRGLLSNRNWQDGALAALDESSCRDAGLTVTCQALFVWDSSCLLLEMYK
jgi:hypothetical protein